MTIVDLSELSMEVLELTNAISAVCAGSRWEVAFDALTNATAMGVVAMMQESSGSEADALKMVDTIAEAIKGVVVMNNLSGGAKH